MPGRGCNYRSGTPISVMDKPGIKMTANDPGKWIFGYGSLIWRPGFDFIEQRPALLRGAHRSLCVYSIHHRGTRDRPGLVFGLVRGGACRGMAFRVHTENFPDVNDYLKEREQVTNVYREVSRPIRLPDGQIVSALTYVVDETHPQFAGRLTVDIQEELVRNAHGGAGPNIDYVVNTVRHLQEMGFADRHLQELTRRLG